MDLQPLFSIGVTTYDRVEMLKETLSSILSQTFTDFEVIVANDNPTRNITGNMLGINDPRIRFINHQTNLGELNNMNFMMHKSKGRYFTWISDDDLYSLSFLEEVHSALSKYDFPDCVFTSFGYIYGDSSISKVRISKIESKILKGYEFINLYCRKKLKTMGHMGVFNIDYLKKTGWMEDANMYGKAGSYALYSEYLLILKSSLLNKIIYINAPLTFYRIHSNAWGLSNQNVKQYRCAGENLIGRSLDILKYEKYKINFFTNLYFFLKLIIYSYISVLRRSSSLSFQNIVRYFYSIKRYLGTLKGTRLYSIAFLALLTIGLRLIVSLIFYELKKFYISMMKKVIMCF